MASLSPVRAALPLWVLAFGVLAAVASLYVGAQWNAPVKQQAGRLAEDARLLLAAVESGAPSLERIAERHYEQDPDSSFARPPSLFVIDRDGQPQLIFRPPSNGLREAAEGAIDWQMHMASARATPVQRVTLNEQAYLVAIREARNGRAFLALAAPAVPTGRVGVMVRAVGAAGAAWLLLAGALWVVLGRVAQRPLDQAASFGSQLAEYLTADEPNAGAIESLLAVAEEEVGPASEPWAQLAGAIEELHTHLGETRAQLNALFQVHSSYILLATLDGTLIDANPAFYAAAELPHEVLRGAPSDVLDDIMPLEPILKLARRSQSEGAAFADIEYAIKGTKTRPVNISLLAVPADGRPAVLIVAADKMKERTLERQIETFSDSLDLMVDKRVEELTSGQERVDALVAATGAVLVAFDRSGATRRWNDAAQRLTGQGLGQVPRVDDLPRALGLDVEDTATFSAWLFGDDPAPCVVTVHAGASNAELYAWHRASVDAGELNERRALVGLALPPFDEAAEAEPPPVAGQQDAGLRAAQEQAAQAEARAAAAERARSDAEVRARVADAQVDAVASTRLHHLAFDLEAPLDSMQTYLLRLQSIVDALPAEAQTCLQMIDGAVQMIASTLEQTVPDLPAEARPAARPDAASPDLTADAFESMGGGEADATGRTSSGAPGSPEEASVLEDVPTAPPL